MHVIADHAQNDWLGETQWAKGGKITI